MPAVAGHSRDGADCGYCFGVGRGLEQCLRVRFGHLPGVGLDEDHRPALPRAVVLACGRLDLGVDQLLHGAAAQEAAGLALGGHDVGAAPDAELLNKLRKARTTGTQRDWSALDDALEIARGRKSGDQADQTARTLVYAYTSRARLRNPFRCTPLQKEILHVLALAEIPPTTSAIAKKIYRTEGKVYDAISELADALVPHGTGEQDRRDSRERLYWLIQNYGVWIRLVDQRRR
jgi:hypothetical protein